jgi:zinc ribbon protein
MSHEPSVPGEDASRGRRTAFRAIGFAILVIGVFFLLAALVDFFGAMSADEGMPSKFWMAFVGLPLIVVGGWFLQAGFVGAASRYVASETAPAGRTTSEPWQAKGEDRSCPRCGKRAAASARFCDACGAGLG